MLSVHLLRFPQNIEIIFWVSPVNSLPGRAVAREWNPWEPIELYRTTYAATVSVQPTLKPMQFFMVKVDLWSKWECLVSGEICVYLVKMSKERVWEHNTAHFRAYCSGFGLGLCWVCVSGNEASQPENLPLSHISTNSRCIGSSPLAWEQPARRGNILGSFLPVSPFRRFWVFIF